MPQKGDNRMAYGTPTYTPIDSFGERTAVDKPCRDCGAAASVSLYAGTMVPLWYCNYHARLRGLIGGER